MGQKSGKHNTVRSGFVENLEKIAIDKGFIVQDELNMTHWKYDLLVVGEEAIVVGWGSPFVGVCLG